MTDDIENRLRQIETSVRELRRELMLSRPPKSDPKTILLQLVASLTLADHMGDVADEIRKALEMVGIDLKWDDLSDLSDRLGELGVTTLWGTSMASDDE